MRAKRILSLLAIVAMAGLATQFHRAQAQQAAPPAEPGLTLTTPAFEDGSIIPPKYTQSSTNFVSPKLEWSHVPAGVVSFTLIFHDPDAALDKKTDDVLHWLIFNIPGSARELPEAVQPTPQLPDGSVQAKNRRGAVGYLGPGMGPAGPYHHYTFELFALDTKLDLGPDATRHQVLEAMNGHILAKAVMGGRFHR